MFEIEQMDLKWTEYQKKIAMKLRVGLLSFALFVVESLEVDAANHHRALLDNEDRELDDYQVCL